mgnify:CR=1 FL=1
MKQLQLQQIQEQEQFSLILLDVKDLNKKNLVKQKVFQWQVVQLILPMFH